MSRFTSVHCDACGKEIHQREWMWLTVGGNYREETTFDICKDCQALMDRALTIGLRLATNGNGERLVVVAESERK